MPSDQEECSPGCHMGPIHALLHCFIRIIHYYITIIPFDIVGVAAAPEPAPVGVKTIVGDVL